MTPEWTEGVCSDGAAILRDGEMVPITDLLDYLNRAESARLEALEEAAKIAIFAAAEHCIARRNHMAIAQTERGDELIMMHEEASLCARNIASAIRALNI